MGPRFPALLAALVGSVAAAADPTFPPALAPTVPYPYVPYTPPQPVGLGYGFLAAPAYDLKAAAEPATVYDPRPGDIILSGSHHTRVYLMYYLAFTGPPAHCGIVVQMPNGKMAVAEAGQEGDLSRTRFTPLTDRLPKYAAEVWVRRRATPLSPDQCGRLTEFAAAADGSRYALARAVGHGFGLFRTRGPLRTYVMGEPQGFRSHFFCGELVIEALVYAGVVDAATARPSAVYPRDLFFDKSTNPYLSEHPPIGEGGWEPPARWCGPKPTDGPAVANFVGPAVQVSAAPVPPTKVELAGAPPFFGPSPVAGRGDPTDRVIYKP